MTHNNKIKVPLLLYCGDYNVNQMLNMKKMILLSLMALPLFVLAQVKSPVKWATSSKLLAPGKYQLTITAVADKGWHIYSQNTPEGGPVPTAFSFGKNPLVTLEGKVKETGKLEKKHEELFGVDVLQYSGKVDFIQVVKTKPGVKTNVTGSVEFMLCNDKECLPPTTHTFTIALN
jgi:thiol:disulfide interchange protein DsbD